MARIQRRSRQEESDAHHFRVFFTAVIGWTFWSIAVISFIASHLVVSYLPVSYLIQGEEVTIPFECTYDKVSSRLTDDIEATGKHIINGRVYYYSLMLSQVYWVIIASLYAYYYYHKDTRRPVIIYCPAFMSVIMTIHHFVGVSVWQNNGGCEDTLKTMDFRALREGFQSRGEFKRGPALQCLVIVIAFDFLWICLVCTFLSSYLRNILHEEAVQRVRRRSRSVSVPRSRSSSRRNNRVLGLQVRRSGVGEVQIIQSRSRSARRAHITGRRQGRRSRSRSRNMRRSPNINIVALPNANQ